MRIVFMGTPEFARKPLERLYNDGHDIAGVFTQPDRQQGRGMKLSTGPVKELALEHGTPVYQPVTLRNGEAAGILNELQCDLIAVVAYGKLLPSDILAIPLLGCINIHGSLLPKYRGAAPIQHSILNGETETGVTSIYMAEEMDAGDMIAVKKTPVAPNETSADLYSRLSELGAVLLSETVASISNGTAVRIPQNHNEATFAPLLDKSMSPIDWTCRASEIKNKVRGLYPWPAATAEIYSTVCKVFTVEIFENKNTKSEYSPGEIISAGEQGIAIFCSDGVVAIKELQPPGGRRMNASDFVRGRRL